MDQKRILVVDDEEAELLVLKNSLSNIAAGCEVVTATDGLVALEQLTRAHFDVVITDYWMPGMDGLELLESICINRPDTRVILVTAYSSEALETESRRLNAYQYLKKPFELDTFRRVVREALADAPAAHPELRYFSKERDAQINQLLAELQVNAGARCTFITSTQGNMITHVGNIDGLPLEQIAVLASGGIAAMLEAGRTMDGSTDTLNISYRESEHENLFAVGIGSDYLLLVITESGPHFSRFGTVFYFTRQTAIRLRDILRSVEPPCALQTIRSEISTAVQAGLDLSFDEVFQTEPASKGPFSTVRNSKPGPIETGQSMYIS